MSTDAIPRDRELPGVRHYSVGFLSYRLPTIMDVPDATQVFVNSLEPRWFYGSKGFAETAIGSVPGALANAIYNACGVRIREHPITREKIMGRTEGKRSRRRDGSFPPKLGETGCDVAVGKSTFSPRGSLSSYADS